MNIRRWLESKLHVENVQCEHAEKYEQDAGARRPEQSLFEGLFMASSIPS